MIGVLSFLIIILVTILINQIAAILLEQTGVDRDRAKLEALSAWTTCGFTTSGSETMVSQPVRRHIIMKLMFFGHAGISAAGASLILGFIQSREAHNHLSIKLPILIVGITLLLVMKKSDWLARLMIKISPLILGHIKRKEHTNKVRWLCELPGDSQLSEIFIQEEHPACGNKISDLPFAKYNLKLLGIINPDDNFMSGAETPKTLEQDYKLVTFGASANTEAFHQEISAPPEPAPASN